MYSDRTNLTISTDIGLDCPLGDFLTELEKFGSPTIIKYIASGPAGGNPFITLQFNSPTHFTNYINTFE